MAATFMVGAQLSIAMVHNRKLCTLVLQVPVFYGDMAGEVWGHAQPLILRPCKLYVSHAVSLLQPPALPCLALALGSGVSPEYCMSLVGNSSFLSVKLCHVLPTRFCMSSVFRSCWMSKIQACGASHDLGRPTVMELGSRASLGAPQAVSM